MFFFPLCHSSCYFGALQPGSLRTLQEFLNSCVPEIEKVWILTSLIFQESVPDTLAQQSGPESEPLHEKGRTLVAHLYGRSVYGRVSSQAMNNFGQAITDCANNSILPLLKLAFSKKSNTAVATIKASCTYTHMYLSRSLFFFDPPLWFLHLFLFQLS